MKEMYVMKINTALSNKPLFVRLSDDSMSINSVVSEAIATLKNTGKPLEADQLEQLYKTHQIFNSGSSVNKGDLFKDLKTEINVVNDQSVNVAEIDLITSHSGGVSENEVIVEAAQVFISGSIETALGNKIFNYGDYIITFANGDKYPCDKEEFEASYEKIDTDDLGKTMYRRL